MKYAIFVLYFVMNTIFASKMNLKQNAYLEPSISSSSKRFNGENKKSDKSWGISEQMRDFLNFIDFRSSGRWVRKREAEETDFLEDQNIINNIADERMNDETLVKERTTGTISVEEMPKALLHKRFWTDNKSKKLRRKRKKNKDAVYISETSDISVKRSSSKGWVASKATSKRNYKKVVKPLIKHNRKYKTDDYLLKKPNSGFLEPLLRFRVRTTTGKTEPNEEHEFEFPKKDFFLPKTLPNRSLDHSVKYIAHNNQSFYVLSKDPGVPENEILSLIHKISENSDPDITDKSDKNSALQLAVIIAKLKNSSNSSPSSKKFTSRSLVDKPTVKLRPIKVPDSLDKIWKLKGIDDEQKENNDDRNDKKFVHSLEQEEQVCSPPLKFLFQEVLKQVSVALDSITTSKEYMKLLKLDSTVSSGHQDEESSKNSAVTPSVSSSSSDGDRTSTPLTINCKLEIVPPSTTDSTECPDLCLTYPCPSTLCSITQCPIDPDTTTPCSINSCLNPPSADHKQNVMGWRIYHDPTTTTSNDDICLKTKWKDLKEMCMRQPDENKCRSDQTSINGGKKEKSSCNSEGNLLKDLSKDFKSGNSNENVTKMTIDEKSNNETESDAEYTDSEEEYEYEEEGTDGDILQHHPANKSYLDGSHVTTVNSTSAVGNISDTKGNDHLNSTSSKNQNNMNYEAKRIIKELNNYHLKLKDPVVTKLWDFFKMTRDCSEMVSVSTSRMLNGRMEGRGSNTRSGIRHSHSSTFSSDVKLKDKRGSRTRLSRWNVDTPLSFIPEERKTRIVQDQNKRGGDNFNDVVNIVKSLLEDDLVEQKMADPEPNPLQTIPEPPIFVKGISVSTPKETSRSNKLRSLTERVEKDVGTEVKDGGLLPSRPPVTMSSIDAKRYVVDGPIIFER